MTTDPERRELYPPIEPNHTGFLEVGSGHKLYYEECGNPHGKPAVFLHGGPGGGCSENMRRFWNPDVYRIVLFDQRGSGKSTPHANLEDNTTWDLVNDIEILRAAGLDDGQILEINQVTAYFNYANRTVLGLGIDTDGDIIGLSPGDSSDPDNWSHA